jgi:hypothetical protein
VGSKLVLFETIDSRIYKKGYHQVIRETSCSEASNIWEKYPAIFPKLNYSVLCLLNISKILLTCRGEKKEASSRDEGVQTVFYTS